MISFKALKFGWASAEQEGANEPNLLLAGFMDVDGIAEESRSGNRFMLLGYKGSGKSAVSEHLRLQAQGVHSLFISPIFLGDFPYGDFSRLVQGDDPEVKYPTAWSWLILVKLFDSLSRDQAVESGESFAFAIDSLKKLGLLPTPSLKEMVLTSSSRTFKIKLPVLFESEFRRDRHEQNLKFPFFVEKLKNILVNTRSPNRHILIIDGLDDILTSNTAQYQSLAGLVLEISRLNALFTRSGSKLKILLLCRTDLFQRLPGSNKNKIRQDSAIVLDWYHDPRQPGESNLVKLVNLKAKVTDPGLRDVFATHFPRKMIFRKSDTSQSTTGYLLDFTRHTPRDFIQVLTHIQKFSAPQKNPLIRTPLSQEQILSGLRSYSINYFLPEIKDELVGYYSGEEVEAAFSLIGSLRKRSLAFGELEAKAAGQKRYASLDIGGVITALFECSALGNIHKRPGGTTYFTFRYRNRNSTLNLQTG